MNREEERVNFDNKMVRTLTELKKKKKEKERMSQEWHRVDQPEQRKQ